MNEYCCLSSAFVSLISDAKVYGPQNWQKLFRLYGQKRVLMFVNVRNSLKMYKIQKRQNLISRILRFCRKKPIIRLVYSRYSP